MFINFIILKLRLNDLVGVFNFYMILKKIFSYHFLNEIKSYYYHHKKTSILATIIFIFFFLWIFGFFGGSASETSYVLARVEKGTIISSVSASGQVSTVNQIDIKPKASGDVIWVGVKAGDMVYAGQALASIDSTTAKQTIADAEASLAAAKLQYQKDSAQAPIDYEKSVETLSDAKKNLDIAYNDTYNTISNAYLDLPGAVTGMQDILYGYTLNNQNSGRWNVSVFRDIDANINNTNSIISTFADIAERDYKIARTKYDQAVLDFKVLTRYSTASDCPCPHILDTKVENNVT